MANDALQVMLAAAKEAGDAAHKMVASGSNKLTVKEAVPGADFFTEADVASQEIVVRHLNGAFPDIPIVSEEMKNDAAIPPHCFVVDPIDGTACAANGAEEWAVMIAHLENHVPQRAVIYSPGRHLLAHGARGQGVYLNDTRVTLGSWPDSRQHAQMIGMEIGRWWNVSEESRQIRNRLLEQFSVRSILSAGYGILAILKGETPAWVNQGGWVWDHAPGRLFMEEAGGVTCDFAGNDLDFTALTNMSAIHAVSRVVADSILAIIKAT